MERDRLLHQRFGAIEIVSRMRKRQRRGFARSGIAGAAVRIEGLVESSLRFQALAALKVVVGRLLRSHVEDEPDDHDRGEDQNGDLRHLCCGIAGGGCGAGCGCGGGVAPGSKMNVRIACGRPSYWNVSGGIGCCVSRG